MSPAAQEVQEVPESEMIYLGTGGSCLVIKGVPYILSPIEDEGTFLGWRLTRPDGDGFKEIDVLEAHEDIPQECSCEAFTWRPEREPCKHLRACQRHALVCAPVPVVLQPTHACPF